MTKEDMKATAEKLVALLKASGFVVQHYEAFSTDSIYIKLDYGVCNSIRISDHPGKRHLQYRYNVITTLRKQKTERSPQGWSRHFYPPTQVRELVRHILHDKARKIEQYRQEGYEFMMKRNKNMNADEPGFWSQSVIR